MKKIENFSKSKDTVNRTKQQFTDWKKIFTYPTSNRELISKIYNELKKLDTNNPNNPIKSWGTELSREFSIEESQMAKKPLKKCSTSLVIWKMKIKMTLRLHPIHNRMTKIKNSIDSRCWQGCGER
jgi:hypothetical protein